jgi:hypothetical protein
VHVHTYTHTHTHIYIHTYNFCLDDGRTPMLMLVMVEQCVYLAANTAFDTTFLSAEEQGAHIYLCVCVCVYIYLCVYVR